MRLISDQTPLNEVFKIFKASYSHLMIAIRFLDPDTNTPIPQVCLTPPQAAHRHVYTDALAGKAWCQIGDCSSVSRSQPCGCPRGFPGG